MVWAARAVTASEEIDTIVRADCHAGYIAEGPPGGHLRPVFHFAERAPACATQLFTHGSRYYRGMACHVA